jgi:hypothetical protein
VWGLWVFFQFFIMPFGRPWQLPKGSCQLDESEPPALEPSFKDAAFGQGCAGKRRASMSCLELLNRVKASAKKWHVA